MAFVARAGAIDCIDAIDFEVNLDIFTKLLGFDAVVLNCADRFAEGGGNEIGEGTNDGLSGLEVVPELERVFLGDVGFGGRVL
jgi:hypothetical protein